MMSQLHSTTGSIRLYHLFVALPIGHSENPILINASAVFVITSRALRGPFTDSAMFYIMRVLHGRMRGP